MKVVINKCFGGFSLSPLAVKRIAELNGRECYFFVQDIRAGIRSTYIPATIEEAAGAFMFWAFSIPNPNDALRTDRDWCAMSDTERVANNAAYAEIELSNREYERNDPKLVQAVEELGAAANGSHADLRVVKIPDGVDYEIDEYDGLEHIAEKHRTWG